MARGEKDFVVRLVTGSQIWLPLQEQVPYEHHALQLLAPSGVTPRPYHVDPEPESLPYPLIIEEYLSGLPLDYATEVSPAARCVAEIHAIGIPADHQLQLHPDPAPAILAESRGFADPYLDWDGASTKSKEDLRQGFEKIEGFLEQEDLFTGDDLAVVNYDLNTHNFVVDSGVARLLDWEKARIARTQYLAHFLLPTTTLWRDETATLLSPEQEEEFVEAVRLEGSEDSFTARISSAAYLGTQVHYGL